MNRINKKFNELRERNEKALITYITAGDPDLSITEKIIYAKIKGGADIIELGIPFSDPLADGPVIQEASIRSLKQGTTPEKVFCLIEKLREKTDIPLVLLVYYNTILSYGLERFVFRCKGIVDGVIIPDLPFEESGEILPYFDHVDTALIPMLSPTSHNRIENI
jgi:tryptophan synthase alpha chain